MTPNIAFTLYEKFRGEYGLQAADHDIITKLMEDLGGDELVRFMSLEYAVKAQQVYDTAYTCIYRFIPYIVYSLGSRAIL